MAGEAALQEGMQGLERREAQGSHRGTCTALVSHSHGVTQPGVMAVVSQGLVSHGHGVMAVLSHGLMSHSPGATHPLPI